MKTSSKRTAVDNPLSRLQEFSQTETASGLLLLACAIIAMVWANSPWAGHYFSLWHTELSLGNQAFGINMDLHHWINDGLMVLFFFVVGLEIKRELLVGELSQPRQAMLPLVGAFGGMLVPAAIYLAINFGRDAQHGWGIPVATDIAFALTVLALLGPRVPTGLKVFLLALAIVDDLGAVLVIALFYTHELNLLALGIAAAGLVTALILNRGGEIRPLPYSLLGIVIWAAILASGVHATVAGVLLAFCIPARSKIDVSAFIRRCKGSLAEFEQTVQATSGEQSAEPEPLRLSGTQHELVSRLERTCEQITPPLDRLENFLHPWIAFLVMPLFALSNAGVALPGKLGTALLEPVSLGVILGLVLGKPLGVTAFVWLTTRIGLTTLPAGVTQRHIFAVSWVCGIGFTMSLFIANLAFSNGHARLDAAKLAVLIASVLAGCIGFVLLRRLTRDHAPEA